MVSYKSSCLKSDFEYVKRLSDDRYVIRWNAEEYSEGESASTTQRMLYNEMVVDSKPTYQSTVSLLIHERYSIEDEMALNRQKDRKAEDWEAYDAFCEQCKAEAKKMFNIED